MPQRIHLLMPMLVRMWHEESTPQGESPHLVSDCKSHKLSFQVWGLELRRKRL